MNRQHHNETRNNCHHCTDILLLLVPWLINTPALKGNRLCRPLGWQDRGIKMHRGRDANSWSHVGEQSALQIRLQGKGGPPAREVGWYSWVANPGNHQNPWHHQAALQQWGHSLKPRARVTHMPALQLSEGCHLIVFILLALQKGRYGAGEPFWSSGNYLWIKENFDSNFRADLKTLSPPLPMIALLSASFWHFLERMILMVQSVAEGTVTFYADARQSWAAPLALLPYNSMSLNLFFKWQSWPKL